jgi:hypothetical protein
MRERGGERWRSEKSPISQIRLIDVRERHNTKSDRVGASPENQGPKGD